MSRARTAKQIEVSAEAKASILDAIRGAAEPLKAAQLAKLPGMPKGLTGPKVRELLEGDLNSGGIFNWGSDKTPAYWHRVAVAVARERLLDASAVEALSAAELTKRAAAGSPKLGGPLVKKVQAELVREKALRAADKKRFVNAQRPEAYLETHISGLLKAWNREIAPERIRELLGASASVSEVADKIFAAMNRIAFAPGTTVTFFRLRQQPELAEIPKAVFDKAALLLQAQRRALLSVHDHAAALPPEERERFVTDGLGSYYVSLYAR